MSMDSTYKTVVYSFGGDKAKFAEWKAKTLSLARVHKVSTYLTTDMTVPTEAEIEGKDESDALVKAYDKNVKAFDILVRSCTDTPLMLIQSVENGNARKAWKALLEKYEAKKFLSERKRDGIDLKCRQFEEFCSRSCSFDGFPKNGSGLAFSGVIAGHDS